MMHTTMHARPTQQLSIGRLGEVIQWGQLGPGGFPAMSLQGGRGRGLGELIRWGELGPGGFPAASLQGLGQNGGAESTVSTGPVSAESAFAAGPFTASGKITIPPWGIAAYIIVGGAIGWWARSMQRR